jgi:hypothetical protein
VYWIRLADDQAQGRSVVNTVKIFLDWLSEFWLFKNGYSVELVRLLYEAAGRSPRDCWDDGTLDFLLFCSPLHPPRAYVSQPKMLVCRDGYHYQHS